MVTAASKNDRVSVGDMKRALQNAGMDTSSYFERSDFEHKYVLLSDSEKAHVRESVGGSDETKSEAGDSARADSQSSTSSSATEAGASGETSKETSKEKDTKRETRDKHTKREENRSDSRQKTTPNSLILNVLSFVRESANRLEVKWGVGAKLREQTLGFRQTITNLDGQLGLSRFFKTAVPPAWQKLNQFRATPIGRVCTTLFYVWLFVSGAFWTLLSFGLTAVFLTNLLFPQFFAQRAQKMQQDARSRFAQQQQQGGGRGRGMGGPGGMGGMGNAGGPAGMGGMGGMPNGPGGSRNASGRPSTPPTQDQYGRKSYGSGTDGGAVFDVDADVKDV